MLLVLAEPAATPETIRPALHGVENAPGSFLGSETESSRFDQADRTNSAMITPSPFTAAPQPAAVDR